MSSIITLDFYKEKHLPELLKFCLPPEQEVFTALPKDVLHLCLSDRHRFPIVVLLDDVVVGFFILHYGRDIMEFIHNPNAILLRSFSINYRFQKNGYAKQTLKLVLEFIKNNFSGINQLILAVNEKNTPAQNLYLRCGYSDTSIKKIGPKGPQLIFQHTI